MPARVGGGDDAAVRHPLPGQEVGVVLDVEVEHLAGVHAADDGQAAGQQVQRIGGVPGEDHRIVRAAAHEIADNGAGVLVDRGADLGGIAGAAVDAGVERQDFVEVGRDHGQGGRRGAVVQVGVADVAALDQRRLDLGAGHRGQRPARRRRTVHRDGRGCRRTGVQGWREMWQSSWDLARKGPHIPGIRACRVRSGPARSSPGAPRREWRVAGQQTGVSRWHS